MPKDKQRERQESYQSNTSLLKKKTLISSVEKESFPPTRADTTELIFNKTINTLSSLSHTSMMTNLHSDYSGVMPRVRLLPKP